MAALLAYINTRNMRYFVLFPIFANAQYNETYNITKAVGLPYAISSTLYGIWDGHFCAFVMYGHLNSCDVWPSLRSKLGTPYTYTTTRFGPRKKYEKGWVIPFPVVYANCANMQHTHTCGRAASPWCCVLLHFWAVWDTAGSGTHQPFSYFF